MPGRVFVLLNGTWMYSTFSAAAAAIQVNFASSWCPKPSHARWVMRHDPGVHTRVRLPERCGGIRHRAHRYLNGSSRWYCNLGQASFSPYSRFHAPFPRILIHVANDLPSDRIRGGDTGSTLPVFCGRIRGILPLCAAPRIFRRRLHVCYLWYVLSALTQPPRRDPLHGEPHIARRAYDVGSRSVIHRFIDS